MNINFKPNKFESRTTTHGFEFVRFLKLCTLKRALTPLAFATGNGNEEIFCAGGNENDHF